jgi:hypothetical protein
MQNLFDGCHDRTLNDTLQWLNEPPEWRFEDHELIIVPQGETDFFRPYKGEGKDNACLLYTEVTGDFTAVTQAHAHLVGFGDAAAITVRAGEALWAKLCLERSPIGDVAVVSVVTQPWSDDANGELQPDPVCFLRITRKGDVLGMHASRDGETWRFVRTFGMALPARVKVGIHAQAPFGGGCHARFSRFMLSPTPVEDFRSGE